MSDKFTLRVMLLGGRRTGKTSILASMYNCFEKIFIDTPFIFTADNADSEEVLIEKNRELKEYFIKASKNENFVPDDHPTLEDSTYSYFLRLRDKNESGIRIEFYDYPGEWLESTETDRYEKMLEEIKKSHILIIVLDTPYLMEEDGLYNDRRNLCDKITSKIKKSFIGTTKDSIKDKMVLLLPIKCEYLSEKGDVNKVTESVKREYSTLISSLKDCNCTIALLPILTIGTALFTDFERNSKGEVIMYENSSGRKAYPSRPLYYFSKRAKEVAKEKGLSYKYSDDPKYCEQPLLYIVLFAINMYIKIKEENDNKMDWFGKIFNWFATTFLNWAKAEDFIDNKNIIEQRIKVCGDGFEIIADPLHISNRRR